MEPIKTALGTYHHSVMAPEVCTLLRSKKTESKSRGKSINVGSKVLYHGHEATVIAKHATKGWWTVEVMVNGNTITTSGDRSVMTVL